MTEEILDELLIIYKHNFKGLCKELNRNSLSTLSFLKKHNKSFISKQKAEALLRKHKKLSKISKLYNCERSTIQGIFNRYGLTTIKTVEDDHDIDQIKQDILNKLSISKIARKHNMQTYHVIELCKKHNIDIKTKFDLWENDRKFILDNIDKYVEENKEKHLYQIAIDNKISIEQLKWAFRETNNKPIIHAYNKSKGQIEIENYITNLGFDCYSKKLKYCNKLFEIDCFVENKNFGLEYCGEYWHSCDEIDNKNYHKNKFFMSKALNINLITIFEHEFQNKKHLIYSMIKSRLGLSKKIYGRNTQIKEISNIEAHTFHSQNHINGYVNSSINIGLYKDDILYSVLSFSKSRFNKKYQYEITRYSTKMNYNIVGGFSKMFSYFRKTYNPKSCMTYSDLRFGEGNVYLKSGFEYTHTTDPNYWYYNKKNPIGLESRMKYQKKKLRKLFPEKIGHEYDIMADLGYLRIYDCGSNVFTWISN